MIITGQALAECNIREKAPEKILRESFSGFDICDDAGGFIIIKSLLQSGDIYPVQIKTNLKEGRIAESKLRQLNETLARQIQECCDASNSLKKDKS